VTIRQRFAGIDCDGVPVQSPSVTGQNGTLQTAVDDFLTRVAAA
jgi:hypothetical protein